MKLKATIVSLEEVSEAHRDLYTKGADGKYYLDLDGEPQGFVPRNRLDEFRTNNVTLMKKLEDLEQQYKGLDPEAARKALEEITKIREKKLIDEGQIEELVATRTEAMRRDLDSRYNNAAAALEQERQQRAQAESRLSEVLVNTEVLRVIGDIGVLRRGANTDVMHRAKNTWRVVDGELRAMDGETPIYGKDGKNPLTMHEWCQGLAESASYLFEESKGSGSNGAGASRKGEGGSKVVDRRDPVAFGSNLEDIASGKAVVRG